MSFYFNILLYKNFKNDNYFEFFNNLFFPIKLFLILSVSSFINNFLSDSGCVEYEATPPSFRDAEVFVYD